MRPNENVRFECAECGIVFDLCVAPPPEWAEPMKESEIERLEIGEPTVCPFCAVGKLTATHERAEVQ